MVSCLGRDLHTIDVIQHSGPAALPFSHHDRVRSCRSYQVKAVRTSIYDLPKLECQIKSCTLNLKVEASEIFPFISGYEPQPFQLAIPVKIQSISLAPRR